MVGHGEQERSLHATLRRQDGQAILLFPLGMFNPLDRHRQLLFGNPASDLLAAVADNDEKLADSGPFQGEDGPFEQTQSAYLHERLGTARHPVPLQTTPAARGNNHRLTGRLPLGKPCLVVIGDDDTRGDRGTRPCDGWVSHSISRPDG
jgi:hypothetical protein